MYRRVVFSELSSYMCDVALAACNSCGRLEYCCGGKLTWLMNGCSWVANGVPISGITLNMLPVDFVDVTGPKIMTVAISESLGQLLGRTVDDRDFSGIKQPKLLGDVLIIPGNSFAARQNGYPTDQETLL